jgi:predicted Zn-dependent protease
LQRKQSELEQARQQAEQAQYEQAVNQIRADAKMLIAADERFETIKAKSMEEAVVELIKETYEKTGSLMDLQTASQQVEDYLVEEGLSFAQLKKVQSKLAPKAPEAPAPKPAQQKQNPLSVKPATLTNSLTAKPSQRLSERERIERAKAAFHGQRIG